jgi:hypothetical protein
MKSLIFFNKKEKFAPEVLLPAAPVLCRWQCWKWHLKKDSDPSCFFS